MTVTRRDFLAACTACCTIPSAASAFGRPADRRPLPSTAQLAWQRDELAMFLHFGVNTFTDREWGDGREDPAIFAPTRLDARQWARAARAGGFRAMILTAKHHDGFCLWPTTHDDASRGGESVARRRAATSCGEFVEACRAEGLQAGLYLSPWDRNNPLYGDSPRYNDLYAISSPSCSPATGRSTRSGSTARTARGRTASSRSTTGRACGRWCGGCSRTR